MPSPQDLNPAHRDLRSRHCIAFGIASRLGRLAARVAAVASVTAADSTFRFDGVPPGRYTLHVWHERLGTRETRVRVDGGVQTRLQLAY